MIQVEDELTKKRTEERRKREREKGTDGRMKERTNE